MNNLIACLAVTTAAIVIAGAVPNSAGASEKGALKRVNLGRTGGMTNWLKLRPAKYNSESHGFDEPWPFGPESSQQ